MKKLIITSLILIPLMVFTFYAIKAITLKQNCIGYLKRAADANTIDMAKTELKRTIDYLEQSNLTSGYTSAIYKTPNEDIGFWYNNLKQSYAELDKVDSLTSALERTNILLKLRETLLDNGEDRDRITFPHGLSRYPNNLKWGIGTIIASILFLIGLFMLVPMEENNIF